MATPIQTIAHTIGEATRTFPSDNGGKGPIPLAPIINEVIRSFGELELKWEKAENAALRDELTRAQLSMVYADVEVLTGAAQALIHSARAIGGALDQFVRLK